MTKQKAMSEEKEVLLAKEPIISVTRSKKKKSKQNMKMEF